MNSPTRSLLATCAVVLLVLGVSPAQSLSDAAREERGKQQARNAEGTRKVITDDDLPAHNDSAPNPKATREDKQEDFSPAAKKSGKSAEQWKKQILAQENVVSSLENEITRLSASVHYVEVNRYTNGVQYNQYQAKKQDEVTRLQKQLEGEKKKLEDLQESARKAGFGSSVYEP